MPWPKEHKIRTRGRIVEAAATTFRARGVSGVRLEEIMADAGLTHGGFYAHFASKDELLDAAVERANEETLEHLSARVDTVAPERRLHELVDLYLSPAHAAHPERGCPIAALGAELARSGGTHRQRLAAALKRRLAWMRGLHRRPEERLDRDPTVGVLACMIGGVILARTMSRRDGAAVLAACREFLHAAIDAPPASD
ncbi:MAG: TetR/AcrR family transcriptional regulator [Thermoanaerobaculia bacterium]